MKKLLFFLSVCFLPTVLQAQWQWAQTGINSYESWALDIASDDAGNIYVCGSYNGQLILGKDTLNRTGSETAYLAKYNSAGQELWARNLGICTGVQETYSVGLDKSGNIYVAGEFSDTLICGNDTFTCKGLGDAFVVKYDPNGNNIWAKAWGSAGDEHLMKMAIDKNDNIYIAGSFGGAVATVAFYIDTVQLNSYGDYDVFLAALDTAGNVKWVTKAGTPTPDVNTDIKTDPFGNIYLYGGAGGYLIIANDTTWSLDKYLAKFDKDGNALWVSGGKGNAYTFAMCIDAAANAYITGNNSYLDFGQGKKSEANFIAKYSAAGSLVWEMNLGADNFSDIRDVTADTLGNIYIAGAISRKTVFGADTLYCNGQDDILVAKYDNDGNYIWSVNAGGTTEDYGNAIVTDINGDILLAANINSAPASFGNFKINASGKNDMCVAKLSKATTGIDNAKAIANTITIYPNPASQEFSVSNPQGSYTDLKLYDATGRLLLSQSLNKGNTIVDIRHINVGIYYITFTANDENITPCYSKLLVQ